MYLNETLDNKIEFIEQVNLKKSKRDLNLREKIKDQEWFFSFTNDLPADWIEVNFMDITWLITCGVAKRPTYVNEGIPFLSAQNARPFKTNLNKIKFISEKEFKQLTIGGKPERGDILYTRVGNCGEAAKINYDFDFGIYVSLTLIKPIHELIDSDYLVAFLNSYYGRLQANVGAIGIGLKNLNVDNVRKFRIPLPPIEIQKQIVSKIEELFSELDKGVEELKTAQQQLKVYRQAVLKWAFEGKLTAEWRDNNPSVEIACDFLSRIKEKRKAKFKESGNKADKNYDFDFKQNENIRSWATGTLDKLIYIAGRIGWRGLTKDEYTSEGPLFLSVHALNYGKNVEYKDAYHVSRERYLESPEIMLTDKDILLCKDGAGIGKIGIINNLPSEATVNSSLLVIRGLEVFVPEFLFYLFSGPALQLIVRERITGSATPHLFQNDIRKFELQIPPKEEQQQIVQEIESRLSVCDKIEETITDGLKQAESLRQSILGKAFEGRLVYGKKFFCIL